MTTDDDKLEPIEGEQRTRGMGSTLDKLNEIVTQASELHQRLAASGLGPKLSALLAEAHALVQSYRDAARPQRDQTQTGEPQPEEAAGTDPA